MDDFPIVCVLINSTVLDQVDIKFLTGLKGAKSKKRVKSYFLLHCVSPSCSVIGQSALSSSKINPRHRRYVWGCGPLSLIYHALPREPITQTLFPAFTEKQTLFTRETIIQIYTWNTIFFWPKNFQGFF